MFTIIMGYRDITPSGIIIVGLKFRVHVLCTLKAPSSSQYKVSILITIILIIIINIVMLNGNHRGMSYQW